MSPTSRMFRVLLIAVLLSGCQRLEYKEFRSSSVLRDLGIGSLDVEIRPDGTHIIKARDVDSMQTEGLKAAVEGAVTGAAKALKP